jgi:hypothetical protein
VKAVEKHPMAIYYRLRANTVGTRTLENAKKLHKKVVVDADAKNRVERNLAIKKEERNLEEEERNLEEDVNFLCI